MKDFSILFFLFFGLLFGTSISAQADLTVNISGIEARGEGKLVIMIFDSAEAFKQKFEGATQTAHITNFSSSASHTFGNLPAGNYAVMVFQDLNENGTMDTNFIGFPKEPIGASNLKRFGKPSYKRAAIAVGDQAVSTDVKLFNQ